MRERSVRPLRRLFSSRLLIGVLFAVAAFVSFGVARAYYQEYQLNAEIDRLQEDVRQLERKKLESLDLLAYVLSPAFVEEKARVELNMKRPGEEVMIIPGAEGGGKAAEAEAPGQIMSNPLKWFYYFTAHALPPKE